MKAAMGHDLRRRSSNRMKWKDALIASSMPLELEIARILVADGFTVNADVRYFRGAADQNRDATVDLHARRMEKPDACDASFELLVNCVTRGPDAAWLFLPDLTPSAAAIAGGGTPVRMMDQFSSWSMASPSERTSGDPLPVCAKGIEIDTASGNENGPVFRNAVGRLQNALPRLLIENILMALAGPRAENRPFFFCPVLITSAPLYILKPDTTPDAVETAGELSDVCEKTGHLALSVDYGPEFRTRCMTESAALAGLLRTEKAMEIERKKTAQGNGNGPRDLPLTIMETLMDGEYACLHRFFTRFPICSSDHFPALLTRLTTMIRHTLGTARMLH